MVSPDEIFPIAGRTTVTLDGRPVSVARLSELLSLQPPSPFNKEGSEGRYHHLLPLVKRLGLLVDSLITNRP